MACEKLSFSHLCSRCQTTYIVPNPQIRILENGLKVLSFFAYDEVDFLLKTKHTPVGYYIYTILAQKTMRALSEAFKYEQTLSIVPVDDRPLFGYAHTAILAKHLRSKRLEPLFACLQSSNDVRYSGKPLEYRLTHARGFKLHKRPQHDVVLVDDVVTTGTTLSEASALLSAHQISTLMAVVLADANR